MNHHFDHRNYPRVAQDRDVCMLLDGETHTVRCLDVSAGGARISLSQPISRGTQIRLIFQSGKDTFQTVPAIAVHSGRDTLGVRFNRPIHRARLGA